LEVNVIFSRAVLAMIAGLAICEPLAAACDGSSEADCEQDDKSWEFSLSTLTYLAQHERDYANPNFGADYDWLHLEARYNYEALKTGSVWLGRNFEAGKTLKFEVTPMLGGVFGNITGIAPGYEIRVTYNKNQRKIIELSTEGEYFFDAGTRSGDFFYSWSEFSASLPKVDCVRAGLVVEQTQASSNSDVRRGPLVGFNHKCKDKDVDLTIYWLAPGSREATFVFGVTVNFKP
jgi:hypothetical protein